MRHPANTGYNEVRFVEHIAHPLSVFIFNLVLISTDKALSKIAVPI